MSLRKAYETDAEIERSGIEFEAAGGAKFKLARAGGGNTRYAKTLERLCRPYRKQIQTGTLAPAASERIVREAFVDAVLLGWSGVTWRDLGDDRDGDAPFTRDNALRLFAELPDLFSDLQEISAQRAAFLREALEADAGN